MSLVEEGLVAHLLDDAAVAAIIGTRVHPLKLPQNPTLPAVVYHKIGSKPYRSQGGRSGISRDRFDLDCHAETYTAAKQLANKVRIAVDCFSGSMGSVPVQAAFKDGEDDNYSADTETYFVTVEAVIFCEEATS